MAITDITPPAGGSSAPTTHLKQGTSSLLRWGHLANYEMLGASALIILLEIVNSGSWLRLGFPLLFIALAITNLASMRSIERKRVEQSAATDRGVK